MRRIARMIPVLAAALLMSTGSGLAIERTFDQGDMKKDECLLVAMNCRNQVDSIQERISRLQGEIGRGRDVYSADELMVLRNKLEDANKTLETILNSGGA